MKKIRFTLLVTVILFSLMPATILNAAVLTATKTSAKVTVDGIAKSFDAYTINGNNYFKLRDIAYILLDTTKQFEVTWDGEKNSVSLFSGIPYTVVGGELALSTGNRTKSPIQSSSKVYLDGKEIKLTAYTIDGNNYFKLRDLGSAFDFYVGWDGKNNNVEIESIFSYVPENGSDSYSYISNLNLEDTQQNNISNWAYVSPVQQFFYKDEGLAYAYVEDNLIIFTTPSNKLSVDMKYPSLGDVIADDEGNFYVVWGKIGNSNTEQTIFISKYSQAGEHIKTTGFVGGDITGNHTNTKIPFSGGNCVATIHNGILMVNYARIMYNGHQSNNVVAVNIADMSSYEFEPPIVNSNLGEFEVTSWDGSRAYYLFRWDDGFKNGSTGFSWGNATPYVSHSFNQSVIYSERAQDFIFVNHGDAYERGFIIDKLRQELYYDFDNSNERIKSSAKRIFNFYLEANANYDMWIVNKTFAQLGGLAETSEGVLLVGASAKSISEAAKTEKQNLFIQIFDPLASELSESAFVGGTTRSGATSFDINDNQNSPLTKVTDYGVIWLTNYTDKNVIAPQVVVADDRIVILWTEENSKSVSESFYMVLSARGDIITPATSLGSRKLNSYEMPVYHNGLVYWAYTHNGKLRVVSIKP